MKIKRIGSIAARDFENVTEARAGNQCRLGAAALDERIDDQRGAVVDKIGFTGDHFGLLKTIENSLHEIIVSGRALRVDHLLGFMIEGDEIGEGAADIDGDCVSHCTLRLKWMNYKGCRMKKWSNGVLE